MTVNFRTFKISWNPYFLNYLWYTLLHGQHIIDSRVALSSKCLTLPNVYAFILSNFWLCSWASQDLVWPFTPRQLMNSPPASGMMCALHGMWFLSAGHSIAEASSVECSSCVIELFEEALWVVIPSNHPSVSSKQSRSSLKCRASLAPVWWPLTWHSELAFEIGKQ